MEELSTECAKCFVPAMLVDFIERNCESGKEGLEPCSYFIQGVCLLVDISGFTKLSGEYCSLGREGIDGLQLATNGYMGSLVEIIYSCGGEIIKFAGDAIICVFASGFETGVEKPEKGGILRRSFSNFGDFGFSMKSGSIKLSTPFVVASEPTSDKVSTDAVLRAMHCANLLRDVQTSNLTVHVAMSCGEMCFGILGGVEDRWECLISGPCIHELSDCLDDAPSKTAVMTKACAEIVKGASGTPGHSMLASETADLFQFARAEPQQEQPDPACAQRYSVPSEHGQYVFKLLLLPSGNHRIVSVTRSGAPLQALPHSRKRSAFGFMDFGKARDQAKRLIRQFVPVPIAEDIEIGRGLNFIAEIREVTTMFMKVRRNTSSLSVILCS
jgi:class 3 adenylate cyclase